jgi:hypothetical protein
MVKGKLEDGQRKEYKFVEMKKVGLKEEITKRLHKL